MKIIIAIVVHNRFQNIQRWLECWKQCEQHNAELIIIHNDDKPDPRYEKLCQENQVGYIQRPNIGYDVGAFQDVCRERLQSFPNDWDYLFWLTDDVMPMTKDFITPFLAKMQKSGVGIACMQLSREVYPHIRTNCFCIDKQTTLKLKFPADPIINKYQCYLFEHKGRNLTLKDQVQRLGLTVVQIAPDNSSPFWDMNYRRGLKRLAEHQSVFSTKPKGDKITFICPIYEMYPQIVSSLLCQTHKNWELLLIHNGPQVNGLDKIMKGYDDPRIKFIINPIALGNYGHPIRQWALNEIKDGRLSDPDYIVITNADNYHVPVYCEYMLKAFNQSFSAVAVYCSEMVHNYQSWRTMQVKVQLGHIDCAGVMVKRDVACDVGWRDAVSHSSDWTYFSDIVQKYGIDNFIPAKGCLLIHN